MPRTIAKNPKKRAHTPRALNSNLPNYPISYDKDNVLYDIGEIRKQLDIIKDLPHYDNDIKEEPKRTSSLSDLKKKRSDIAGRVHSRSLTRHQEVQLLPILESPNTSKIVQPQKIDRRPINRKPIQLQQSQIPKLKLKEFQKRSLKK